MHPSAEPAPIPSGMKPRRTLLVAAALAAAVVAPPPVAADTTIGVATPTGGGLQNNVCVGTTPCTYLPFRGSAPAFVSPVSGTIVRWRIAADSAGAPVRLRVLRPDSTGTFAATGSSATELTTGGGSPDVFTTNLPIRSGDALGLDNNTDALLFRMGVPGDFTKLTTPFLSDGASSPFSTDSPPGYQLQINADVVTPATPPPTPTPSSPTPSAVSVLAVGAARVTPARFRAGKRATVSFSLSGPARYRLTFHQATTGRMRGRRCVAQPRRVRTGRRCTAYVRRGSILGDGKLGDNRVPFRGRVAGRALRPGRYRVTLEATAAAGTVVKGGTAQFRLLPALRRRR